MAAGLRPDPLGSTGASPEPLIVFVCQGMEHYPAVVMGAVWRVERAGYRIGGWGREDRKRANGKVYSNHHCQRLHFQFKMHQKNFGGRTPPGPTGELKCIPRPASRIGGQGREHSLAAVRALSGEEGDGSTWKGQT